jgi:hypothetical protein
MTVKCTSLQMGLETAIAPGTLVAATHKWDGQAEFEFLDKVETPEYLTGEPGAKTVEDAFISGAGSRLTLKDTPTSFQQLVYLLNMGVKLIVGPVTSFPFTFPTVGACTNAISTFTWEVAIGGQVTQEYEFGYGFASKISLHGDAKANEGQMFVNAVIEGQKAIPSTLTGSLGFIPAREMMNLRAAMWDLNALGTAFETPGASPNFLASPTVATLRGFSLDIETGFYPGFYADGKTNKDFSIAEGGGSGYKLSGKIKGKLNAAMVTEIANARSATGKIMQIVIPGSTTLLCDIRLPILWSSAPKLLSQEEDGMWFVEFDFISGYSRTTTAQAPSINLTTATLTVT